LLGQLKSDKTNLTVLLEPGEDLRSQYSPSVEGERPQDLPLGGAEEKRRIANAWTLRGRVTDAETGGPIGRFRVTPGRRPSANAPWTDWQYARGLTQSNGVYQLDLSRNGGYALVQAEAEGYVPAVSDALAPGSDGANLSLRKGAVQAGVVVTGRHPAVDTQVAS
jgi:hypothetical protein